MSVVGVDLGNDGMVISAPSGQGKNRGAGGIDIVLNEASHRRTQTLISFQNNQRFIGESAASLLNSNLRNTVTSIKRFIGCKFNESIVQEEMKTSGVRIVELPNNRVGFKVNVNGDTEETFLPEQLLAMLLYRVKEITDLYNENNSKSFDVVLSVPPYYSDSQRRSVIDACSISGIKCLRLLNENICAAVSYGIYKSHQGLFDNTKPQYIMIIDMGQASCYATVAGFVTGKLKILASSFDRHLGGRDIDHLIVEVIADEFLKKHGIDLRENKKSMIKLRRAAEVVKKNLSPVGMTRSTINIECVYEDYDYNGAIELETLITLMKSKQFDKKLEGVVQKALDDFKKLFPNEIITSYEIIGGSLRVPFLKETLANFLKLDKSLPNMGLSTTLNMDECVSIGAGWLSAILSPRFRIKDYVIMDNTHYPVKVLLSGCDINEKVIDTYPTDITVSRNNNSVITVKVQYDNSCQDIFPTGHEMKIGEFQITLNKDVPNGTPIIIRFDYDQNGLFGIRAISNYHEVVESIVDDLSSDEETKKETKDKPSTSEETKTPNGAVPPDTQEKGVNDAKVDPPKEKKEKKTKIVKETKSQTKIYEIIRTDYFKINSTAVSIEEIKQFRQLEGKMRTQDHEIRDRAAKRNDLESFIYNTKEQLGDLGSFAQIEEKYLLKDKLDQYGNWLYSDEGHEGKKVDFETRLNDLQSLANPMKDRKSEWENRLKSTKDFKEVIENYRRERNEPFRSQLLPILKEYETWIDDLSQQQGGLQPYDVPILKVIDILNKTTELKTKCENILNPPKPKEEKKEEKKEETKEGTKEETKEEAKDNGTNSQQPQTSSNDPPKMEEEAKK